MGKLHRVIAASALLCACSRSSTDTQKPGEQAIPRARAAQRAPAGDPRLDAQGQLQPGSLKLSWLEIPIGFERRAGSTERNAAYEAEGLSVRLVREYLMARGRADEIDYLPRGENYHRLRASHTQLPLPPLDILVLEVDPGKKRIRMMIDDLAPTGTPLTPTQAMEALAKARDRVE
jgi:hypothetical protein